MVERWCPHAAGPLWIRGYDNVTCPACGWWCERADIREVAYGESSRGYIVIHWTEAWCPSCGHDWPAPSARLVPSAVYVYGTDVATKLETWSPGLKRGEGW